MAKSTKSGTKSGTKRGELAKGRGRYTAVYDRDEDGVWIVEIRELPHCHTYGDSLSRARSKIREALGLWVEDSETAEIVDDVKIPSDARNAIKLYQDARDLSVEAQARASTASRLAVRELRKLGLSTRDAADVTGLSQQRIAQLDATYEDSKVKLQKLGGRMASNVFKGGEHTVSGPIIKTKRSKARATRPARQ